MNIKLDTGNKSNKLYNFIQYRKKIIKKYKKYIQDPKYWWTNASIINNVKKVVCLSTDKAVYPINAMGISKAMMEKVAIAESRHLQNTTVCLTRYGNVMASRGSVIPLFQKQIENGGPVTVTDERITRYFMTIPEACQLVLEAATMGKGGEIFVFEMGQSVKIIDLAKKMIQLSGLEIGKDIELKFTGLRPGEKLYEELLANEENTIPTHHPQILKAKIRHEDETQITEIENLIQQKIILLRELLCLITHFGLIINMHLSTSFHLRA